MSQIGRQLGRQLGRGVKPSIGAGLRAAGKAITDMGAGGMLETPSRFFGTQLAEIGKDFEVGRPASGLDRLVLDTQRYDAVASATRDPVAIFQAGEDLQMTSGFRNSPVELEAVNRATLKSFYGASSDFTSIETGFGSNIGKYLVPIAFNLSHPNASVRAATLKLGINHLPLKGTKSGDANFKVPVSAEAETHRYGRVSAKLVDEIQNEYNPKLHQSSDAFTESILDVLYKRQAGKAVDTKPFASVLHKTDEFFSFMKNEAVNKGARGDWVDGMSIPVYRDRAKILADEAGFRAKWEEMLNDAGIKFEQSDFQRMMDRIKQATQSEWDIDHYVRSTFRKQIKAKGGGRPDYSIIKEYLDYDFMHVVGRYARTTGADIAIAGVSFGDPTGQSLIESVKLSVAREAAGMTGKQRDAYIKSSARAIGNLEHTIRSLRRLANIAVDPDSLMNNLLPTLKNFSYTLKSGFFVLSNLNDVSRGSMFHGLKPYAMQLGDMISAGVEGRRLGKMEALQYMESFQSTGQLVMSRIIDLADHATSSKMVRFSQKVSHLSNKLNLMEKWVDVSHTINILSAAHDIGIESMSGRIDPVKMSVFSQLGLDKSDLDRIGRHVSMHGTYTRAGRLVPNIDQWNDPLAVAVFKDAVNKSLDFATGMPNTLSVPIFMGTRLGSTVFQFWGFMMGNVSKQVWNGLSHHNKLAAQGIAASLAMGMGQAYLKSYFRGRPIEDMGSLVRDGIEDSGILAALPGLAMLGLTTVKSMGPNFEFNFGRYISNDPRDLLGPAFGTLIQAYDSSWSILKAISTGEMPERREVNGMYGLLPMAGMFYLRYFLTILGVDPRSPAYDRQSYREDPTGQDVNRVWDFPSQRPDTRRFDRQTYAPADPDAGWAASPHDGGGGLGMGGLRPMGDDRSTLGPR